MSRLLEKMYPKNIIEQIISKSYSIADFLRRLDLKANGANYSLFRKLKEIYNLSDSHFTGMGWSKGKKGKCHIEIPIENVLVENSNYTCTSSLKRKLKKFNLIEDKCSICSINSWQGKEISLQLDHINGINNDNRLENIRLLCPNCHSQTTTFAGKNIKSNKPRTYLQEDGTRKQDLVECLYCKTSFIRDDKKRFCSSNCSNKFHKGGLRKTRSPNKHLLEKLVWSKPTSQIAKDFGVSDNAVAKWCKKYNIAKPPRGYWAKKWGLAPCQAP